MRQRGTLNIERGSQEMQETGMEAAQASRLNAQGLYMARWKGGRVVGHRCVNNTVWVSMLRFGTSRPISVI